jgi:hypothetical protein
MANFHCVTTVNVNLGKDVTTGVIDTDDNFATGVNDARANLRPMGEDD